MPKTPNIIFRAAPNAIKAIDEEITLLEGLMGIGRVTKTDAIHSLIIRGSAASMGDGTVKSGPHKG